MAKNGTYYYGYLVHVPRTVKKVLNENPAIVPRVRAEGVGESLVNIFNIATETFGQECGIPLRLRCAWIGNGRTGFIWILPSEMRKMKDNEQLRAFKSLMGIHGDPVVFSPIDGPEPAYLRNIGSFQKEIEEMLADNCFQRPYSEEWFGDVLGDLGMTRLTLDGARA
jgi:hypothetical protein